MQNAAHTSLEHAIHASPQNGPHKSFDGAADPNAEDEAYSSICHEAYEAYVEAHACKSALSNQPLRS